MRTSVAEVSQSQGSCGSSGQCYQTVAQCNVSTISSKLDGNQTLKVWPPSRVCLHESFGQCGSNTKLCSSFHSQAP